MSLVRWMDEHLYGCFAANWDDELLRRRVLARLTPEMALLDLGAGAGLVTQMNFKGLARRVCGVDPDPRVLENPLLDEGRIGLGEAIPYPDATFDLAVADNVLEHLPEPARVLAEIARTLKPGGRLLVKTPNRRHYVPTIARLTPHWFHQAVNRRRGRHDDDTFATLYRANTPGALRRLAPQSGLKLEQIWLAEGRPEYLRFNAATYLAGWCYERAVNLLPFAAAFRVILMAEFVKPAASGPALRQAA